jgi:hypothetical protein
MQRGSAAFGPRNQSWVGPGRPARIAPLEDADYISSEKTRNGAVSITTVALTGHGRTALGTYTRALRDLLGGL